MSLLLEAFLLGNSAILTNVCILPLLLPIIYGLVILLGLLMLVGRNPFTRLRTAQAPRLAGELLYFFVFGLGFGWPLVLPLVAAPLQRRFTRWITGHHRVLTRASGVLLVVIGLFGLLVDWLPNV